MNKLIYLFSILSVLIVTGCEKDVSPEAAAPELKLEAPTNRGRSFITLNGTVSDLSQVKELGFMIWKSGEEDRPVKYEIPDLSSPNIQKSIKNLEVGTTYIYYMFAGNNVNLKMTEEQDFTTPRTSAPLVGATEMSNNTGMDFTSSIEDTGGSKITTQGFCWNTGGKASIFDNTLLVKGDLSTVSIPELQGLSVFHIRAFAQNEEGYLAYGPEYVYERKIQWIEIPDKNFKQYLVEHFDTNKDNEISPEEAALIQSIEVPTHNIQTLKGIEYFPNLVELDCAGDPYILGYGLLTSLDVSQNSKLEYLSCSFNPIEVLDVSKNLQLKELDCDECETITSLTLGNNSQLEYLICDRNQISLLNTTGLSSLIGLYCYDNPLKKLDLSKSLQLTELDCSYCQIQEINLSHNTLLEYLECESNQLTSLDLRNSPVLKTLRAEGNDIKELDLSNNTRLTDLSLSRDENSDGKIDADETNPNLKTIWVWKGFDFEMAEQSFSIPANATYKIK